ncbi:armadillo-type protein [Exophiala viscosa]|uniref:Armadillo-type protein n=1 Tax=Exophiala viscosa TaxID=2486360 RepID=A0AAN6DYQ7_9EURO|nr:armadillo-type protein [Exophiala viscosa]KAI1624003.1 armadillo-type protein [Exophiala viscosa]
MEQQVLQLLEATTRPDTIVVKAGYHGLLELYSQPDFPFALLTIATHNDIETGLRKAAVTTLKNYVSTTWSPQFDDSYINGSTSLDEEAKARVRDQILAICTAEGDASKDAGIQALAAGVASKIASVDFPDAWPSLFPALLTILNNSTNDAPIHGALRVLAELVDSGLTEEQFFTVAPDLVNALQHVVSPDNNRSLIVRAMALNVFRSCFEMLEMVMGDHGVAVKAFLDESMRTWMPLFMETLKEPLDQIGVALNHDGAHMRGLIALKVQVVKTLDKLRSVYVHAISPHAVSLFQIVWEELSRLAGPYAELFLDGHVEGKLVDSDNLPHSLDALVLEEIDFLQVMIKAPPVRSELSTQMKQLGDAQHTVHWLQELIRVLVLYSRIPKEEEALWEYDSNLYLSEATSLTANYTPRAACGELVVRSLGEWLKQIPIIALLHYKQQALSAESAHWKEREALLYLLNQCLVDVSEFSGKLDQSTASILVGQVSASLQDSKAFMRAAAHLTLATFFKVVGDDYFSAGAASFTNAINASVTDPSEVVKVACLSAIPNYLEALPSNVTQPMQGAIFHAIEEFISSHDLKDELEDADDVKAALIQTLRDGIMLDTTNITETNAIDLFFTLASDGAANFQLFSLLTESFEGIVSSVASHGQENYVRLCSKTIPALTGAFDIASMTQMSELTNLAAELVSALAEFGAEPLPEGFVPAVMPKLQRVLMEASDAELVRPATLAVEHMLSKGSSQFLTWSDSQGKSAIEVLLTIINRLLNSPDVDENAGQEVGGLASTLVNKFGADKLGPYLMDLLRAVAVRLATADTIQFIQSLCMVFVGLTLAAPKEVLDFLAEVNVNGVNGLNVVLTKWLENSVHFAGFDEVRQNVVALSKVFSLQDPRVKAVGVKGDLIIDANPSGRIKTRSMAKLMPDRWTNVPADLKILKIMVDELASAATSQFPNLAAAQAAADALDEEDDDADDADDWEDVGTAGAIDLASSSVRNDLMALVGEGGDRDGAASPTGSRARDEETAEYLLEWFKVEAQREGFAGQFEQLNDEEKGKLRELVA